jgi:4-hydroxyphenylacetate 3-monooxygenase
MSRDGKDYIRSLRDGRAVYINGELVDNHVDHPAFRNAVRTVAKMYDFQAEHQELMTFKSPGNGRQVNLVWKMPTSKEDLVARGEAHLAWARLTGGWIGRSPDHVPAALVGMMAGIELFEQYDPKRGGGADGLLRICARQRPRDDLHDCQPARRSLQRRRRSGLKISFTRRG